MSVDNRTMLNDCEDNTGWVGNDSASAVFNLGEYYEGTSALSSQFGETIREMYTTQDSVGAGTFNIDLSDSTVYWLVKDNLIKPFADGGMGLIVGDGTDRVGYYAGGNDAVGCPLNTFYNGYKLDVSVVVATPGSDWVAQAGSEANLAQTAVTEIGLQAIHLDKARGPSDNIFYDAFRYISNDSYALTINGGTSGTPETMADVAGDDQTNGWGLIGNPIGVLYYFNGPTEWGTPSGTADTYFSASGEQWIWLGDNGGGKALGAGHMPMRIVGNGTGTNSFVISNTAIVNSGTGATVDFSNTDMDTVEIDACTFANTDTISAPSSGGTSRFMTNCTFSECNTVTSNDADMSGNSYLSSIAAVDGAALSYTRTISSTYNATDLEGSTFLMGANNHHAISFSTATSNGADITFTNMDFDGFDADGVGDSDNSILEFLVTTGTITVNLINCRVDGVSASSSNFTVDTRAGCTVNVNFDPKTVLINVRNSAGTNIQNARVFLETNETVGGGEVFQGAITSITQTGGTATVTTTAAHGLETGDLMVIRGAQPDEYNKVATATVTGGSTFTYPVDSGLSSPATATPVVSYVAIQALTDASGNVSVSRTWGADQNFVGWARLKNTTSPFYQDGDMAFTVDSANGNTVNVVLQPDE
jgi:hypothetical protein